MSCSTYTYRDYATEYAKTEDMKSWQPVCLNQSLSQDVLGIEDGVASLVERTDRNPFEDNDNGSESPIDSSRVSAFPELTMELMEECLMEPLIFINDHHMPPHMINEFMPTVNVITGGIESTVLVSASTYGIKNLIFKTTGCVLCMNESTTSLYVPSRLLRKTRDDLIAQSFSCKISRFNEYNVFHKVNVPSKLVSRCTHIYNQSRLRVTTRSHTPLLADGFNKYCNVDLIISISLMASRTMDSSSFDGTVIVQHDKRLIDVVVLDIDC